MIKIHPSMLSANPAEFGRELQRVEEAGADAVHWDIMDGSYVDAITFGADLLQSVRSLSHLRFDAHLMIVNPNKHITSFAEAGADSIIVHTDTCQHLHKTLFSIKSLGKLAGVALNPAININAIEYVVDLLDIVVVMTVNPGSSGQKFIQSQIAKIAELRKFLPKSVEICVDGGINEQTIKECRKHGANSVVSGAYIFNNTDYQLAIDSLKGMEFEQ